MILNQFLMMVCNRFINQCERNPGSLQHELDRSWHWQDGWVSRLVWIHLVLSLQILFSRKWLKCLALQMQQREEDNLEAVGRDSDLGKRCRRRAGRILTMLIVVVQVSASKLYKIYIFHVLSEQRQRLRPNHRRIPEAITFPFLVKTAQSGKLATKIAQEVPRI